MTILNINNFQLDDFKYCYLTQIIFKQIYQTGTTIQGQSGSRSNDNKGVTPNSPGPHDQM